MKLAIESYWSIKKSLKKGEYFKSNNPTPLFTFTHNFKFGKERQKLGRPLSYLVHYVRKSFPLSIEVENNHDTDLLSNMSVVYLLALAPKPLTLVIQGFLVVWIRLWNFIGRRVKFNAFLHPIEHSERICSYLVRWFEAELAKIGHFHISKSIFEAKYDSIFRKPKLSF